MARMRLVKARFTSKGALVVTYRTAIGATLVSTTPRDGVVTIAEAAAALHTTPNALERRHDRGTVEFKSRNKQAVMAVAEVRRLAHR